MIQEDDSPDYDLEEVADDNDMTDEMYQSLTESLETELLPEEVVSTVVAEVVDILGK